MICPYCGTHNSDHATFCQSCGKRIAKTDEEDFIYEEPSAAPKEELSEKMKALAPVAAVAIALLLAAVVFFAVVKPHLQKNTDTASQIATTEETEETEKPKDEAEAPKTDDVKTMYVSSEDGLMLREGPSTDTESVYVLSYATEIKVDKTENNWAHTTVGDLSGWCSMEYLTEAKPEKKTQEATPSSSADATKLVEPGNVAEYGFHGYVNSKEGLNMRYGPGEKYDVIAVLPNGETVIEKGWDGDWMYIECNGRYGWVYAKYIEAFQGGKEKPAIYLYPTKTTDVTVRVDLTDGKFTYTDPKSDSGEWTLSAEPSGKLTDKATGKSYDYIFWESDDNTKYDWSEGYVIKGSDTEDFLRRTLPAMGLNEAESTEFIEYWLPRMKYNSYNLITFQTKAYTDSAKLTVSPKPDSVLRVFMAFKALDEPIKIKEPQITPFKRRGFTVVEWGGTEK